MLQYLPQMARLHFLHVGEELLSPNNSVCNSLPRLAIISQLTVIKGQLTGFS